MQPNFSKGYWQVRTQEPIPDFTGDCDEDYAGSEASFIMVAHESELALPIVAGGANKFSTASEQQIYHQHLDGPEQREAWWLDGKPCTIITAWDIDTWAPILN